MTRDPAGARLVGRGSGSAKAALRDPAPTVKAPRRVRFGIVRARVTSDIILMTGMAPLIQPAAR